MHSWELMEWVLYSLFNIITGIAYVAIPIKLRRYVEATRPKSRNKVLFQAFILCGGIHHLTHPLFMYYDWFSWIIAVDASMAGVSVLAAFKLRFG